MEICPDYWSILDDLARRKIIFSPIEVRRELEKIDDGLKAWIHERPYIFKDIDIPVQEHLRTIMFSHARLVDTIKQRSIADPWVIAFAISEKAIVVTKESAVGNSSSARIKIPDVCNALGVEWIDDFEFAREIGLTFSARIIS